jgi:filamentous hemagglutinin family protein
MKLPLRFRHKNKVNLWIFFLLQKINIQLFIKQVKKNNRWLMVLPLIGIVSVERVQAQTQQVVPASDGTGTIVTPNGNQIDISGGQLSGDKANLFHSFTKFGLNTEQIANFLAIPNIQNILGRVVGGDPSVINGLIKVTGSNANLFLMNPAGIVFGSTASLNVAGAFTATTANGIGFGSDWFSAFGANNYAALVGNPGAFSFLMSQPGAIINTGNLTVGQGQNLTLLGGTIANTGTLAAPSGQILVSTVPGEKLVRLSQPGSPLSLEIQPLPQNGNQAQSWNLPILSLPQLLTSGGGGNATKVSVGNDGNVQLSGSGIPVKDGDIVAGDITAKTATLSANRNLTAVESQLRTTGDLNLLAKDTVQIRDSVANPFVASSGGNLYIQGNQGIDILALNHPETPFQSNGNLSLVSDGNISGDSHFASSGNFSILNLAGNPGNFLSLYDPIIKSTGDVTFGNYTGASLKVEAVGNINANNITITRAESSYGGGIPNSDPDAAILTNSSALILRAGLASVSSPSTFPVVAGDSPTTTFTSSGQPSPSGSITVNGNIDTSISGYGGPVILSAKGDITTGNINSGASISGNGGTITINSTTGAVDVKDLISTGSNNGGAIAINANGDITTNLIRTGPDENINKADVTITSRNGSININNPNGGNSIIGKSITINAPGALRVAGGLNARSNDRGNAGDITIGNNLAPSSITVNAISTRNLGESGGGGGNINITTTGLLDIKGAFLRDTGLPVSPTEPNSFSIASEAFSGSGGAINITANGGITIPGQIASNSRSLGNGGNISLISNNGNITTGNIDTSGFPGGALTLNSGGNVRFNSINTRGYFSAPGGSVNIRANGIVQGIGVLNPTAGEDDSIPGNTTIFTRGTTPGSVRIQHNGGPDNVPFVVGDATSNGTLGAIDAGSNSVISPGNSYPVLPNGGNASGTPSGITIASVNSPPTLTVNPKLNGVEQDKPFKFTYADLNPVANDVDKDNTFVRIETITSGTLTKNGVAVVLGTDSAIISPGDNLEYTPPTGATGDLNPFTISAGDRASFSFPQPIAINITPTPPKEPILPPSEETKVPQQNQLPGAIPPIPDVDSVSPAPVDPRVAAIEDKNTSQFDSFSGRSERRRVSLSQARDILRQIEKATGVKPAIIYVSFIPSGTNDTILQAAQDNDQLDLVVVTAKGEPIHKRISAAKRKDVLKLAEQFYSSVEDGVVIASDPNNTDYLEPSQELYKLIVAPLKEELDKKGINNLLFIADEGLRSLPFAALHDGKQFLVENYSVGSTLSLSLTDTRYVDIRNTQVLAMGASKFQKLNPLPAVPEELAIVAQDIWKGKFFLNQPFTLNNLKSLRKFQPYGILHLATHGEFQTGQADNSFIQLWDSQLKYGQLRNLDLNNPAVELLVLSACRTALGDKDAELGFGGLAYQTGAKTAVASLWQVSDAGTLGLMTEFYKYLKTKPIKSQALQQAQIAMIRGQVRIENGQLITSARGVNLPSESTDSKQPKKLAHPFYWAAFTMIGNPW